MAVANDSSPTLKLEGLRLYAPSRKYAVVSLPAALEGGSVCLETNGVVSDAMGYGLWLRWLNISRNRKSQMKRGQLRFIIEGKKCHIVYQYIE